MISTIRNFGTQRQQNSCGTQPTEVALNMLPLVAFWSVFMVSATGAPTLGLEMPQEALDKSLYFSFHFLFSQLCAVGHGC